MQTFIIVLMALQLLWVGYSDVRFRLIPNVLVLMLMLSAVVLGWITHQQLNLWPAFGILLAGFVLFCLRIVGAGDVKLMSALAISLTPLQAWDFILLTALCGGLVVVVGLLCAFRQLRKKGVPYGVAISMGFLLTWFIT